MLGLANPSPHDASGCHQGNHPLPGHIPPSLTGDLVTSMEDYLCTNEPGLGVGEWVCG
jgi:hypothetical protein